jgi:lysyl-tRNA synthetase class 2
MMIYRQSFIQHNLRLRAHILRSIRRFFDQRGFLEIETPCRIPAPAPESHIDAQPSDAWFLQTSPELCMKQLLAAGYLRIYQVCRCFRQSERGQRHLPEFTMLEWYCAGQSYLEMMTDCEKLVRYVAGQINGNDRIHYQTYQIDLQPPWDRLTVEEAFERHASVSIPEALSQNQFDEVMAFDIEPQLGFSKPVFLYDYPTSCGALAKRHPDRPTLAQRFELYIAGLELCNAFSELTDPEEQRRRFHSEQHHRKAAAKTVYPNPEKFLSALSDMPDAAGNALGIDRLIMLFVDTARIDDVVAFTPEEL